MKFKLLIIKQRTTSHILLKSNFFFDQERRSTKNGDVALLKRVIRSEEGTFTGYIKGLEGTTEVETTQENANEAFANFCSAKRVNNSKRI